MSTLVVCQSFDNDQDKWSYHFVCPTFLFPLNQPDSLWVNVGHWIYICFHLAILTLKNFWNLCKRYYINEIKQSVLKSTKNLSTLIEKDLQILKLEKPKLNKIFNLISQTQLMVKAFCCHSWIWQHNHVIQHRLPRGEFHFHFGLYIVI